MSTAINAIPVPTGKAQAADAIKHLKVSLNDDTRRFSVTDDATKFAQLVKNVRDVYALPANSALLFKYKDEEGDLISVSSATELAEGFRVAGAAPLRLVVSTTTTAASSDAVVAPMLRLAPATPAPAPAVATPVPAQAKGCPKGACPNKGGAWRVGLGLGVGVCTPAVIDTNVPAAPSASEAKIAAAHTPEAKPKADHKAQVALLKERNQALKERCEQFKQRIHTFKAARDAGVVQVATLQRDLQFVRAEKCPRIKAVLARGRFVCDVTVPDGTTLTPGELVTKTWRFRNDSEAAWPAGTRLLFVGKNSDRMGAPDDVLVQCEVLPGAEIDISVPLTAPNAPGRYVTYFRLAGADQVKFGQRVWCSVVVKEASSSDEESSPASAAAPAADADMIKYQHQLQVLAEMNLTNLRVNVRLLNKFDGSLEAVVERLFARRAKWAARSAADPNAVQRPKFACKAARLEEKMEKKAAKLEERFAHKAGKIAAKVEKEAIKNANN